jgi:CRISPR-associated protein (TIGR03984 family)
MSLAANKEIAGCEIIPLDQAACGRYLAWLRGDGRPDGADGIHWALGHFDNGVTWGRLDDKAACWVSSHDAAPDVSPAIREETLQELRLCGAHREVLIWRTHLGLRGRVILDSPGTDKADPASPVNESRLLRGDRVDVVYANGFTLVSDKTGARQVLPMRITDPQLTSGQVRLVVRHYFQRDDRSGAVRVAATRLVGLNGGHDGT